MLRAKIDMASPNMNLRDPVLYRIKFATHPRTGDDWCIYPMYDYTHPISDAIEGITHSICTLEFEDHRPAYDWATSIDLIDHTPRQYEFARLNIDYTLMSKRRLLALVQMGVVDGWDDPRMPTISGIRRRGYSPEAMLDFVGRIGVAKVEGIVEHSLLEFCVREDLNKRAKRLMVVLDPIKVVIDNFPEGKVEYVEALNNPEDPEGGTRLVPFNREVFIEREDFMEKPPKGYHRLSIGTEIRLIYAYYITAHSVIKDDDGNVLEVHCTYDPESRRADRRWLKSRGTSHRVSAAEGVSIEVRLYDKLFLAEEPGKETGNFLDDLNRNRWSWSRMQKLNRRFLKQSRRLSPIHSKRLLLRRFKDSTPEKPIYNRTVTLRDTGPNEEEDGDPTRKKEEDEVFL